MKNLDAVFDRLELVGLALDGVVSYDCIDHEQIKTIRKEVASVYELLASTTAA